MNVLLIGPPGSGKSTQAGLLAERLMIPRIMASEVLTAAVQADSPVAGAIHQAMTTRALVPDDIVIGVLIARLRRSDCTTGFVLDGFPRTVSQAATLDQAAIRLDYVIELTDPTEKVTSETLSHRLLCAFGVQKTSMDRIKRAPTSSNT